MQHTSTSFTYTRKHRKFGTCSYYEDFENFAEEFVNSIIEDARGIFQMKLEIKKIYHMIYILIWKSTIQFFYLLLIWVWLTAVSLWESVNVVMLFFLKVRLHIMSCLCFLCLLLQTANNALTALKFHYRYPFDLYSLKCCCWSSYWRTLGFILSLLIGNISGLHFRSLWSYWKKSWFAHR